MAKQRRIQITVSTAMMVALELQAERSGLPVSTQALAVLRAALDRTIHSADCQDRLRAARSFATRDAWLEERADDHSVELAARAANVTATDDVVLADV